MQENGKSDGILPRVRRAFGTAARKIARLRQKKTLYIHIGTHKTGTSALQLFLASNRERLASADLVYPEFGTTPQGAHHLLVNALKGPPFPVLKPEKSPEQYLEELGTLFDNSDSVLLSSEIFMRLVPSFGPNASPDLSDFQRLLPVADRVCPIVYFRPQEDYLESFYRQMILDQLKLSPEEFVDKRYLDYIAVCDDLAQVFGAENLIVRAYDKSQFPAGGLFADFLSIFDIAHTDEFSSLGLEVNPSFVPDAIEFRRMLNCLGATLQQAQGFNPSLGDYSRSRKLSGGSGMNREVFFSTSLREVIRARSAVINEELERKYLPAGQSFPLAADRFAGGGAQVYAGLGDDSLDAIVAFLRAQSPQLIEVLESIVRAADQQHTEGRLFAKKLAVRL